MKYFLEIQEEKDKLAKSKAVRDCEIILEDAGYKSILIGQYFFHRFHLYDFFLFINSRKLKRIKEDDIVLIRFPLYLSGRAHHILQYALNQIKRRKASIILLIHDLDSIRFGDRDAVEREKTFMNLADVVIAHNPKMAEFIAQHYAIPSERIVSLGIFDYLCDEPDMNKNTDMKGKTVVIAGNLSKEKAGYLYAMKDIAKSITFHLYGVNVSEKELPSGMEYKGAYAPEKLPDKLEGSFGLVWDGNSTDECGGSMGNYLRYNNPHKCSLYIAAGLPIIIWKEAALAEFVKKYHIGIAVNSLNEITKRISDITEEEHHKMKMNITTIGKMIRDGDYLRTALIKAEKIMG